MKKIIKLSPLQQEMFQQLLEEAIDALNNNSCNEFPVDVKPTNKEELREFINGMDIDDEYRADLLKQLEDDQVYFQDFMVLGALKALISPT